jgi:hypothetical protein
MANTNEISLNQRFDNGGLSNVRVIFDGFSRGSGMGSA